MNADRDLVVSAIGLVANEALLLAQLTAGDVASVRAAVEASSYWSRFCEIADDVDASEIGMPALGACVLGWAVS